MKMINTPMKPGSWLLVLFLFGLSGQVLAADGSGTDPVNSNNTADNGESFVVTAKSPDGGNCYKSAMVSVSGNCSLSGTSKSSGGSTCSGSRREVSPTVAMGNGSDSCKVNYHWEEAYGIWPGPYLQDPPPLRKTVTVKVRQYIAITNLPSGADQPVTGDAAKVFTLNYTAKSKSGIDTKSLTGNTQQSFTATPANICQVVDAANRKVSVQSNVPGVCQVTLTLTGTADVAESTEVVTIGVSALERDAPYTVVQKNDGNAIPSDYVLTSETPRVCQLSHSNQVQTYNAGLCVMRATNADGDKFTINWPIVGDKDRDGVPDLRDNCPSTYNPDRAPSPVTKAADGSNYQSPLGEACNNDFDNDSVINTLDNCPGHHNADQAIDLNSIEGQAGFGIACAADYDPAADQDSDGIENQYDNCPFVANGASSSDFIKVDTNYAFFSGQNRFDSNGVVDAQGLYIQKDSDQDGTGDACDTDTDGDSIANALDNCPDIANKDQLDSQGNGVGDACRQVFVKTNGNDNYDCSTWVLACKTIAHGITEAKAQNLNSVFVAGGSYQLTNTLELTPAVKIYAGFEEGALSQSDANKVATVLEAAGKTIVQAIDQGKTSADEIVLNGVTFQNHISSGADAPAVLVKNSRVKLSAKFINNTTNTANTSAAVVADNAILALAGASFDGNQAVNGAAVYSKNASQVTLDNALFVNNKATEKGAAVYQESGSLVVHNTDFKNNTANNGTITAIAGSVWVDNQSLFEANTANISGAALYMTGSAALTSKNSQFIKNTSAAGAIVFNSSAAQVVLQSVFEANQASGNGGAIVVNASNNVLLENNVFYKNTANAAGAVYLASNAGLSTLRHNSLVANEALTSGGAINSQAASNTLLQGNLIAGNSAATGANLDYVGQLHALSQYNLIGSQSVSGITGTEPLQTVVPSVALDKIVEAALSNKGGDGYRSKLPSLAIIGGGPARDLVPAAACVDVTVDARGEIRPDKKSGGAASGACDAGAYEFTVLSCEEDAARRYAQGEAFVKSCDPRLDGIEIGMGFVSEYLLAVLGLLALFRLRRLSLRALRPLLSGEDRRDCYGPNDLSAK